MGMMKREIMIVFVFMMLLSEFSNGSVYKVGDSSGWSLLGNVDYGNWTSSKTFQVGDILVFEYVTPYHNVLQVSRSNFHSCNATAPIAKYTTGNDSIVLRSSGHYYYICGFLGHCKAGQKIDIRVPKSFQHASVPVSSPTSGPSELAAPEASPTGPLDLGPSSNSAQSLMFYRGLFGSVLIVIWALI